MSAEHIVTGLGLLAVAVLMLVIALRALHEDADERDRERRQ